MDFDGDGYYAAGTDVVSSTQPGAGYIRKSAAVGIDCNDNNSSVFQELYGYVDADGDGYGNPSSGQYVCSGNYLPAGFVSDNSDCNDNNASVYQYLSGYVDADGDGYGAGPQVQVCSGANLPSGYSTNDTDCNDSNASYYQLNPGYVDADGDGYGAGSQVQVCGGEISGVWTYPRVILATALIVTILTRTLTRRLRHVLT